MVYDDISVARNSIQAVPHEIFHRASVLDRLFSFLLDYLVLSPLISFLILIFFQKEISIWKANAFSPELKPVFLLLGIVYVCFFSISQSLFIYFWQATPGQYFLKLRILDQQPENGLYFFRTLFRQFGFWFSFLLFGFPWIGILAHQEQKTYYDRLSDMRVVSLKVKPDFFSFEFEINYWQALMATFFVFFLVILVALGWQHHKSINAASYTFNQMKNDHFFCDELKSIQLSERLQTAIALNLVGQVVDDCVDKEADFVLWKSDDQELKSLAYYAKSLTENDKKLEDQYSQSACQIKNKKFLGCQLASAILDHEVLDIYKSLKQTAGAENLLSAVLRYEFGLSLELNADQTANFQRLKDFDTHVLVKKYLLTEILNGRSAQSENSRSLASETADEKSKAMIEEDLVYSQKLIHEM